MLNTTGLPRIVRHDDYPGGDCMCAECMLTRLYDELDALIDRRMSDAVFSLGRGHEAFRSLLLASLSREGPTFCPTQVLAKTVQYVTMYNRVETEAHGNVTSITQTGEEALWLTTADDTSVCIPKQAIPGFAKLVCLENKALNKEPEIVYYPWPAPPTPEDT